MGKLNSTLKANTISIPGLSLSPNESLWKRVPSRLEDGTAVSDFMILIPGLNKRPNQQIQSRYQKIAAVLTTFRNIMIFADLNLKLNLLWVSHKPTPNASIEITLALQELIPESKLIGIKFD